MLHPINVAIDKIIHSSGSIMADLERFTSQHPHEKNAIWAAFYPEGLPQILSQSNRNSLIRHFASLDRQFPEFHQDILSHFLRDGLPLLFNEEEGYLVLKNLKNIQQSFPDNMNQILESLLEFHPQDLYQVCFYQTDLKELLALFPEQRESIFKALVPRYIQYLHKDLAGWYIASRIGKLLAVFPEQKNTLFEYLLPESMNKIIHDPYNIKSLLRDMKYLASIFQTQRNEILKTYLPMCIEKVISVKQCSQFVNFIEPFKHTFPEYTDEIWDVFHRIGLPEILAETKVEQLASKMTEVVRAFPVHHNLIWLAFCAEGLPRIIEKADSIDLVNTIKRLASAFPAHHEMLWCDFKVLPQYRQKSSIIHDANFFSMEDKHSGLPASEKHERQSDFSEKNETEPDKFKIEL